MLFFIQKHFHLKCQLTDKGEFFIHGLPARYFLTSKQSSKVKPSLQEKQLIRFTTKIIFNLSNENWNFGELVFKVEIFPILKSFLMKLLAILTKKKFWYFIVKWATILNIFVIQKTYIVDPWTKCRSGALALHPVKNLLITYNWPSESTVPLYNSTSKSSTNHWLYGTAVYLLLKKSPI